MTFVPARISPFSHLLGLACLLSGGLPALHAMPPPSPGERERYREDGSLEKRLAFAHKIGNHRVKPGLLEAANRRLQQQVAQQAGIAPARENLTPPPAWRGMPTKGQVNVLILLIDFSDTPHSNTAESIRAKVFGDGSGEAEFPLDSLRNWYRRSSYNQLEISGNVLGWYTTAYPRSSVAQTDAGREGLIKEALRHFDAQGHDFTQYDNNGDGTIDYFAVVWTGADTGWAEFWWGYQTSFSDTSFTLDGKTIADYSWQWEARPFPGTFSPGVMIHETGHALGLPDYYDYQKGTGPNGGVGGLDMMDSYGDHNCFSKWLLDWITPQVATSSAVGRSLRASGTFPDALVLLPFTSGGAPFGDYFMVQNRRRDGNDQGNPGDGLLVWHVDSRLNATGTDYLYDNSYTSHKLLRLMEADGLEQIERTSRADAGDYWTTGKVFGSATTPSSRLYDGLYSYLGLDAIAAPAATATFNVVQEPADATPPAGVPGTPTIGGATALSDRLSFSWTQGTAMDVESGIAGYVLQVGSTPGGQDIFDGSVGSSTSCTLDLHGWQGGSFFARVAAMNGAGLLTAWSGASPAITMDLPGVDSAALDSATLDFRTSTLSPWLVQGTEKHQGASSARSGAIGNNAWSEMLTRITGPGTLSFWWKVSSEADYDFLTVWLDATPLDQISGSVDWTRKEFAIPAGEHTLRWVYTKDAGTKAGADTGWVDAVSFMPSGQAAPIVDTFLPATGAPGTRVTLTGTGFLGASAVGFAGTAAASFDVLGSTRITATVPAGATTGPVSVTTPAGTGASVASFVVVPPAVITSFAPAAGLPGVLVALDGTGLEGTTAVAFHGTSAAFAVQGPTRLTATVPAGATSGPITLTGPWGTTTSTTDFVVTLPSVSLSPRPASVVVGQSLTFTALVANLASPNVTWTATGGTPLTGGASTSFAWTAPGTPGTVTINATTVATPALQATLTFVVRSRDLDGDTATDVRDMAVLAGAYGTHAGQAGYVAAADLDGDGDVDDDDLTLWLAGL